MSERPRPDARVLARLWSAVLGTLEIELAGHTFRTWLAGTRAINLAGSTLTVETPNSFCADHLNDRLATVVERVASAVNEAPLQVRFVARGVAASPAPGAHFAAAPGLAGRLNENYRFDTYVAGPANRLASVACQLLFEAGASSLTPVTIHGSPGLGKTHLLHAAAHHAIEEGWSVACLGADEFTDRYVARVRGGGEDVQALRGVRLLAIDDLQYLAGRKATAEELATTIEAVASAGGVCVLASEAHPADLELPERLKSRLAGGTIAAVSPLSPPERRQFVERRLAGCGGDLPPWAIDRLCAVDAASARAVQGAVNAAIALARAGDLDSAALDAALARVAVRQARENPAGIGALIEAVADYFRTDVITVTGRSRDDAAKDARAAAAFALHRSGLSLAQAGAALGGRSKATVSSLVERGESVLAAEPGLTARLAG